MKFFIFSFLLPAIVGMVVTMCGIIVTEQPVLFFALCIPYNILSVIAGDKICQHSK